MPSVWHTLVLVENRFLVAMGGYNTKAGPSVKMLDLEEEEEERQQPLAIPEISPSRIRRDLLCKKPQNRGGGWTRRHQLPGHGGGAAMFALANASKEVASMPHGFRSNVKEIQRWLTRRKSQ